jgi:heme/copper-type cytochrome/quinol oxidase subunit 3
MARGARPVSDRVAIDVSGLPTTTFGHRDLAWWATVGFIFIEGTTLVITAVTYFYLRRNFPHWPPPPTPLPDLSIGVLQVGLMALSWIPVGLVDRAAHRLDRAAIRRWLVVVSAFGIAFVVVRALELRAVHTRWNANAYGSSVWLVLVGHGTLLLVEALEILVITAVFFTARVTERHCSDTSDAAVYWYFMTGIWIPLAAMLYLVPRLG